MITKSESEILDRILYASERGKLCLIETESDSGDRAILIAGIDRDPFNGEILIAPFACLLDPEDPTKGYKDPASLLERGEGEA